MHSNCFAGLFRTSWFLGLLSDLLCFDVSPFSWLNTSFILIFCFPPLASFACGRFAFVFFDSSIYFVLFYTMANVRLHNSVVGPGIGGEHNRSGEQ